MWSSAAAILVLAALLVSGARAQSSLPDASATPGAINPAVTQKTIGETICTRGWTRMVRPPVQYTEELKRQQIHTFGYDDRRLSHYEEDHLLSGAEIRAAGDFPVSGPCRCLMRLSHLDRGCSPTTLMSLTTSVCRWAAGARRRWWLNGGSATCGAR